VDNEKDITILAKFFGGATTRIFLRFLNLFDGVVREFKSSFNGIVKEFIPPNI
jgi:hypothetical protein